MTDVLIRWVVLAAMAAGFGAWCYTAGIHRESDRRDALELAEKKDQDKAYDAGVVRITAATREAIALRAQNTEYYRQLTGRIRNADPAKLITFEPAQTGGTSPPSPPSQLGDPSPAQGLDLRNVVVLFGPDWVGLYNAAWRGAGATPATDPGGAAADAQGTASADPQEILEHTASETEACGDDRKRYASLIRLLRQPPWSTLTTTPGVP